MCCLREKDPSGPFGQVVAAFFNFNQAKVKRKAQQMHLFLNASMVLMTDGNLFLSWATTFALFFRDNRPWPESVENGDIEGGNGQTNSIWSREKML